jgi:hypothetical protein
MATLKLSNAAPLDSFFDLGEFTNAFDQQFQTMDCKITSPKQTDLKKKTNHSFFRNSKKLLPLGFELKLKNKNSPKPKEIQKIDKTNEYNSSFLDTQITRQTSIILETFQNSNSKESFENLFLANWEQLEVLETEYSQKATPSSSSFILDFSMEDFEEETQNEEEILEDHPDLKFFM